MFFTSINIDCNSTVNDIQDILYQDFPFLRFEFYKTNGSVTERGKFNILSSYVKIFAVTGLREATSMKIFEDKKIGELKNDFKSIGLVIVLYRKSGNVWVKASLTDDWSLKMQNAAGENFNV